MKKRFFRNLILESDMQFRERLFRIILLVCAAVSVLAILEGMIMDNTGIVVVPLCALMAVVGASLLLAFKYNKTELASVLLGIYVICILFPVIFFMSGGIKSGTMIWFVLALIYVFLMFSGKRLIIFLVLTVASDVAVYAAGYLHPEWINPMASELEVYVDSLFSIFVVGFSVGAILKVQTAVFEYERDKNIRQTEEVEKISHYRESFFANISHEIRTPINTIVGLNEMTLREEISDEVAENAVNIQNASSLLLSLVNDILDLSQLENQKMKIISVSYDTKKMFEEIIRFIQVQTHKKRLEFYIDIDGKIPSVLYGDERRIRQIMVNLLTNAVKYTQRGSVTLAANADQIYKDTLKLRISVADTGAGIRKEELENLYDSFRRVDEKKNIRIEGSGLGLSIVKQLVDLMGGEITVDSIYTKGSIFTVVLEQKIIDTAPIQNIVVAAVGKNRKKEAYRQSFEAPEAKILVVDDDELNLIVAVKLLRATKVAVDTARSAAECLELTRKRLYNVILLDHMMPDVNGIEALSRIRKQENGLCKEAPVIALTAASFSGSEREYLDYGFDGYLSKPVDAKLLEEQIMRLLPDELIEYRRESQQPVESTDSIQIMAKRKRKRIYVTSDCACDLQESLLEKYDIRLIYLYIKTEHGIFKDTKEIELNNLSKYLTDSSSTAAAVAPSMEEYEAFFADVLTQADHIIHVSLASHAGESYHNAVMAARGFGHVHIIDSGHISGGQALTVLYAASLVKEGKNVREVCQAVEQVKGKISSTFLIPSAKIIKDNGYVNSAVTRLCECFHWHPQLKMRQGKIRFTNIQIGKLENAWRRYIWQQLLFPKYINADIIYITHAGLSVRQQEMIVREVKRHMQFQKVVVHKASVSCSANGGLGSVGIAYMTK